MIISALATDYDGTIAKDGVVQESTVQAIQHFKHHGGKALLVTGREIPDLRNVCPYTGVFDLIVAENGAVLHWPVQNATRPLAPPPPRIFVQKLRERDVTPLSAGEVIVATLEHNRIIVEEVIDSLHLDLHLSMNKGSMMILPLGVDKAFGFNEVLQVLGLNPIQVAGIGDAENDFPFLRICGYSGATANALPFLKSQVNWVAALSHGAGVEEFIHHVLSDLPRVSPKSRARER